MISRGLGRWLRELAPFPPALRGLCHCTADAFIADETLGRDQLADLMLLLPRKSNTGSCRFAASSLSVVAHP